MLKSQRKRERETRGALVTPTTVRQRAREGEREKGRKEERKREEILKAKVVVFCFG